MRITVTQSHIDKARALLKMNGKRRSQCCPIALASGGSVGYTIITHESGNYILPPEAIVFRQRFDAGLKVSPIEFTIRSTRDNLPPTIQACPKAQLP